MSAKGWMRDHCGLGALLVACAVACGPVDVGEGRLEAADQDHLENVRVPDSWVANLPTGTSFEIRMADEVDTRSVTVGSPITGFTVRPVRYAEVTVIPAGSQVSGTVTSISKDPPRLSARFTELTMGETSHPIHGVVFDAPLTVRSEMTDEALKIGGGAGAGALLGGVIGGDVKSAAIGAAAGAAAGTGVALATKAKWAVLPAGSVLSVVLEHPLRVEVSEVPTAVGWIR